MPNLAKERRKLYYERALTKQHTLGHIACPACESAKVLVMTNQSDHLKYLPFHEALREWLDTRRDDIKPRTWEIYSSYGNQLLEFFKNTVLHTVHAGMIREYQEWRKAKDIGPSAINHECKCVLIPMLRDAGLWEPLKPYYKNVPDKRWTPPKVMTQEEEDRFFEIAAEMAASDPELYSVAYLCASITNNSSAAGIELRHLTLGDVDFEEGFFEVRGETAKNEFRGRRIPMNDTCRKQLTRAVERAKTLGAYRADHYIFPFRVHRGKYDVTRPASPTFIRTSFHQMAVSAGVHWLTPHCLRHQVITHLFEEGVPDQTISAIAGHVSAKMTRHYSHTRHQAKSVALAAIDSRKPSKHA